MDEFFKRIQSGTIPHDIFHFWESFRALVSSDLFHLYDSTAAALVKKLRKSWGASLAFDEHFIPSANGKYYSFHAPGDIFQPGQRNAWTKMQMVAQTAHNALVALLKHVRENYVEVDIEQTNKDAWVEFVEFQRDAQEIWLNTRP